MDWEEEISIDYHLVSLWGYMELMGFRNKLAACGTQQILPVTEKFVNTKERDVRFSITGGMKCRIISLPLTWAAVDCA